MASFTASTAEPPLPLSMEEINNRNPDKRLKVKQEFGDVKEFPSCLATRERVQGSGEGAKGMNKKRPRDERPDVAEQVCPQVIQDRPCKYEQCRYSHDIVGFLAHRPKDLAERCYTYDQYGFCSYGINCRFGMCHIDKSTGDNLRRNDPPPKVQQPPLNTMSSASLVQLRKNKFVFSCPRNTKKFESTGKFWPTQKGPKMPPPFVPNKRDPDEVTEERKREYDAACAKAITEAKEAASSTTPYPSKSKAIVDFQDKVYVAPLTTVGNLPFRRIMKKFGVDITCGEMALCSNLLQGQASEWALLKRHQSEDIFGVQLAAGFPDQFTRVAEVIESECEIDFIDMNLGCPIDLVCSKGAGAAFMRQSQKLKYSLIGMGNAFSGPVTVKIRTGWDEKKPFAHDLAAKIQDWGLPNVAAIMLHGRSRLQRYSKLANWDYISVVGNALANTNRVKNGEVRKLPLIGNGDIMSWTDVMERRRDGVNRTAMLARGALIKPWLATEIKEQRHWDISSSERMDIINDFVNFGLEHWGSDQKGVNTVRRFLLEWLSFLCRYVPLNLLEANIPQRMNERPPNLMVGRDDLETMMLSTNCKDWIKISELTILGKVDDNFKFEPKHKANSYAKTPNSDETSAAQADPVEG